MPNLFAPAIAGKRIVYLAFNKSIQLEMDAKIKAAAANPPKVKGSEEQDAIWYELANGTDHVVVNAVAGSGKSFTALEGARRITKAPMTALTYHSLGLRSISQSFGGRIKPDEHRGWNIVQGMREWKDTAADKAIKQGVKDLAGRAKLYDARTAEDLWQIIDHHELDYQGFEEQVIELVPQALELAEQVVDSVDFDDMVWLPKRLELTVPRYDMAISDESQDLGPTQQWLVDKCCDRAVVIGDKYQAIYGFRGADTKSIDNMAECLRQRGDVKEMLLSVTRRCPATHVELAQYIVPHIKAMPTAPQGRVLTGFDQLEDPEVGDLVLCRTNAPLIEAAYDLIRQGKSATILGRSISDGLIKLIDQATRRNDLAKAKVMIDEATRLVEVDKRRLLALPNHRGEKRAAALDDKLECLVTSAVDCKTAGDVKTKLKRLFSDKTNTIKLGTVHKCKGLEADRVWILHPELLPHPMAKQVWEQEQEMNLLYVAMTRAKYGGKGDGELRFVGDVPGVLRDMGYEKEQPEDYRVPAHVSGPVFPHEWGPIDDRAYDGQMTPTAFEEWSARVEEEEGR